DIDVRNPVMLEWAFTTRCRPDHDMMIIKDSLGIPLDPTVIQSSVVKLGFDCTKPIGTDKVASQMVHMPGYFPTHRVNLSDYIGDWRRPAGEEAEAFVPAQGDIWGDSSRAKKAGYRCKTCGFIVYIEAERPAPEYCTQCAVAHLRGEMEALAPAP
ncbi:MAG: hypothetical protein ACYDAG_10250, partial [Chloroflexota bacterium]